MRVSAGTMMRRNIGLLLVPAVVTTLSAALLSLTLPKTGLPWLALPAAAGLFWSWRQRQAFEAALLGGLAGLVYLSLAFSWFGETAGALLGPFGWITVLGPAVLGLPYFVLAALAVYLAERVAGPPLVALGGALAFAGFEALRAVGPLGNPFAAVAYPQVDTPFGLLAPWVGTTGVTAVVMLVGAAAADYVIDPRKTRRLAWTCGGVVALLILAAWAFPARRMGPAVIPVAVVQGNIRQDLKWTQGAFELAVGRYIGLTSELDENPILPLPKLVVWPETVIPIDLSTDPALQRQFRHLADRLDTTLIVGTLVRKNERPFNTLWFFTADGTEAIYSKRRLVPFAETLPFAQVLGKLPVTRLVSDFGTGSDAAVVPVANMHVAPLICWESGFADLVHQQLQRHADVLVISTDDAWFGASAGPYQHAQIAQMRAMESGTWVVRAAATGVSGIIAPDGRFTARSVINVTQVVRGAVGSAVPTFFARIGPRPVTIAAFAGYVLVLLSGIVWRRRGSF